MNTSDKAVGAPQEIHLHLDGHLARAAVFALPVIGDVDGALALDGWPLDIHEACRMLHFDGGMGTETQGLFVIRRLISSSLLANLVAPQRERKLAALMIDDSDRMALGGQAQIDDHLDLAVDAEHGMPLRFLLGCVYTFEHDGVPLHLPTATDWESEALGERVASALAIALAEEDGGAVRLVPRPTVLPPCQPGDALDAGLLELVRQCLVRWPGGVSPHLDLTGADEVELRLVGRQRVMSVRLNVSLVGTRRIETLVARANAMFAGDRRGHWTGGEWGH